MRAYSVKAHQITGSDWLDSAGYDIVATIPHDGTGAQLPWMLRTPLAERFLAGPCDFLSRTLDRPVVDTEDMPGNTGGATLFTALQERLGLKLAQLRRLPIFSSSTAWKGFRSRTNWNQI